MSINDNIDQLVLREITRRNLLKTAGYGIGSLALSAMLSESGFAAFQKQKSKRTDPFAPKMPHFAPKAKRVIYLFMAGAPSQIDLFDMKPTLQKHDGEPIPAEFIKNERFAFIKGTPRLLGSPHQFSKVGKSGQEISNLLPGLQSIADDVTIVKSMHTDQFNHAPAQLFMNTGSQLPGRPSMGSWLTYGLGSECEDLPGFVVLISGHNNPDGGKSCWSSGFLPSVYQGVEFRSKGDPVLYVSDPEGISADTRRQQLDSIRDLNMMRENVMGDPEIETRIAAYEMAYKMQTSVPDLMDISKEPQEVHELYGTKPGEASFGNNCLLARRLIERGVRFVQLYHRGWDHHGEAEFDDLKHGLPKLCQETDKAATAHIIDLKRRGLLEDTVGRLERRIRTNASQRSPRWFEVLGTRPPSHAYSCWMAGGGIKPGTTLGETDDIGYNVVKDPVHVHDLNATILHQMGLDHTRLTYKFQGRNFRLTDVHGEIVTKLLA